MVCGLRSAGSLPIVGVNTFLGNSTALPTTELVRSTEEEKQSQLKRLADFHARHSAEAPAALHYLKETVWHVWPPETMRA